MPVTLTFHTGASSYPCCSIFNLASYFHGWKSCGRTEDPWGQSRSENSRQWLSLPNVPLEKRFPFRTIGKHGYNCQLKSKPEPFKPVSKSIASAASRVTSSNHSWNNQNMGNEKGHEHFPRKPFLCQMHLDCHAVAIIHYGLSDAAVSEWHSIWRAFPLQDLSEVDKYTHKTLDVNTIRLDPPCWIKQVPRRKWEFWQTFHQNF